jgi:hypothetical protein
MHRGKHMTTPAQYRGLAIRIRDANYAGDPEIIKATLVFNMKTILAALDIAGRSNSDRTAAILSLVETDHDS